MRMSTRFVVATPNQASDLKSVDQNGFAGYRSPSELKAFGARSQTSKMLVDFSGRGWIEFRHHPERVSHQRTQYHLTDAGRVALELREILGPDRSLTKAQARGLTRQDSGRVYRSLLALELIDPGDALTEDGQKIQSVLIKYKVEL